MVTEIVRLTRDRITVSYRDPELSLTPELTARLQAYWAKRIEAMAYEIMTGGVPVREPTTLDVRKYREMFPDGNKPRRLWGGVIDLDAVVT